MNLDLLIPKDAEQPKFPSQWATVTQVSPLRIRVDGDAAPLLVTPVDLVGNLAVGNRVWTVIANNQLVVSGIVNGKALPAHTHSADDITGRLAWDSKKDFTDWNDAKGNGWYSSSTTANAPGGDWWLGEVIQHDGNWVTQTLTQFTGDTSTDTRTWRRKMNGSTWGSWYQLSLSKAEQDARYATSGHNHDDRYYTESETNSLLSGKVPVIQGTGSAISRIDSGFYENSAGSPATGFPAGQDGWWHLLSTTHSNAGNYYAMQLASSFFSQGLYYRTTANNGSTAWNRVFHTGQAPTWDEVTGKPGNDRYGWTNLTPAAGLNHINQLQIKQKQDGVVYVRGTVSGTAFASTGDKTIIDTGNVPSWARSSNGYTGTINRIAMTPPAVGYALVDAAGAMKITVQTAGSGTPTAWLNFSYDPT